MAGTRERTEGQDALVCATETVAASNIWNSVEGIDVTAITDGAVCYVRSTDASFRWRQDSVAAPAPGLVVLPAQLSVADAGRWLLIPAGGVVAEPGAPDMSVQYNKAGLFTGSPNFLFSEPVGAGAGPNVTLKSSSNLDFATGYLINDSLGAISLVLSFSEDPNPANNFSTVGGAGFFQVDAFSGDLQLKALNRVRLRSGLVEWLWPLAEGPAGAVLTTNGSGQLTFTPPAVSAGTAVGTTIVWDGTVWKQVGILTGANLANADATLVVANGSRRVMLAATLTANRTLTLSPTATKDDVLVVEVYDTTAFTIAFVNGGPAAGTLYTMPGSVKRSASFKFDGTNWVFQGSMYLVGG